MWDLFIEKIFNRNIHVDQIIKTIRRLKGLPEHIPCSDKIKACKVPDNAKKPERDKEVISMVGEGKTYQEISYHFGISKQRVHQIVKDYRK